MFKKNPLFFHAIGHYSYLISKCCINLNKNMNYSWIYIPGHFNSEIRIPDIICLLEYIQIYMFYFSFNISILFFTFFGQNHEGWDLFMKFLCGFLLGRRHFCMPSWRVNYFCLLRILKHSIKIKIRYMNFTWFISWFDVCIVLLKDSFPNIKSIQIIRTDQDTSSL